MSTSNPLSLDINQLAQRFLDLQGTGEDTGWSDKDHQALYFISAGSEYRLWMPKSTYATAPLQPEAVAAYGKLLDQLEDEVNATLTGSQQSAELARIAAARDELASNGAYPTLRIDTTVDHIRGGGEDDHAAIVIVVFWSQALQLWLPEDVRLGFSWGTDTVEVPSNLIQQLGLPSATTTMIRSLLKKIPVVGWAVQIVSIVQYTTRAWNLAVSILAKMTDDGGRLYFPTVVSETIARILQSITPSIDADATTMTTPDLLRLARPWTACYQQSLYDLSGYRFFAGEISVGITNPSGKQTTGTYVVTLPDLVYLPGGGATMLSFKMTAAGSAVFVTATLLFSRDGELLMVSGTVEFSTGTVYSSPPVWQDGEHTANQMFLAMTNTLFTGNIPAIGTDDTAGLEYSMQSVLMDYLNDLAANTRSITASSSALLTALPPLPSVKFSDANPIASGGKRPALAVAPSGYGVVVYVDDGGSDELWEATVASNSIDVSLSASQTTSYQGGQDPALAMYGSSGVVEVHGGNGNNSLYYNWITLSSGTVTLPDDGDKYDKGENPAVAVFGSRAYELHRDQSSSSDKLYYEVGTFSNDKVSWSGSGTQYAQGDNPAVCACPGDPNLVLAHERDGVIYTVNAGVSSSSSSVSLSSETWLGSGHGPAPAVLSNNFIIVFHQGAGDASTTLCTSIGLWSSASIQWIVTGVHSSFLGTYPGASRRSDDLVVVVYENNDGNGGISGRVATLSVPTGFV